MVEQRKAEQKDNWALLITLEEVQRNGEDILAVLGIQAGQTLSAIRALKNASFFMACPGVVRGVDLSLTLFLEYT